MREGDGRTEWSGPDWTIRCGDCLELLRALPSGSVDAVVTDPPYGLSFMGKKWDYDVPAVAVWEECLRVLKPGGHLLAFAGTRTQHRMAVRIEDAGFEIRDMIAWVYGSGFPKSLDVSKAIDKAAGAERPVVGTRTVQDIRGGRYNSADSCTEYDVTTAATAATADAVKWQGWGTALKPSMEPITVARKPLDGTVAANVLEHGTGALNIDGTRVGTRMVGGPNHLNKVYGRGMGGGDTEECGGRWPANLIHDGSAEVVEHFPAETGESPTRPIRRGFRGDNIYGSQPNAEGTVGRGFGDSGSAARFFYCAKADGDDRDSGVAGVAGGLSGRADGSLGSVTMRRNVHPTVKPVDLMCYLCRLVVPPGGVVLDPFMGSGSTGKAAGREGFRFLGFERERQYCEIAVQRLVDVAPLFRAVEGGMNGTDGTNGTDGRGFAECLMPNA